MGKEILSMNIIPIESGPVFTIGYFVYDLSSAESIIIDTPMGSYNRFIELINKYNSKLTAIILTHSHWDHTADAKKLYQSTNAPVYIHKEDEYRILEPNSHTIFPLSQQLDSFSGCLHLSSGDKIKCGQLEFEVRHTPGHTEGGICLVEHNHGIVFTGDTLFCESIGRFDLPGGNGQQLLESIRRELLTLPDSFKVYSGHGEPTTIGYERINNPFLNGLITI